MKKTITWLSVALVIVAAVVLFSPKYLNKYLEFVSPLSQPAVRFYYPNTWNIKIDQGKIEDYTQVFVRGPRNLDDTYTTAFIVRETPMGSKFKNIDELRQHRMKYIYSRAVFSEQKEAKIDNQSARSFIAAYTIPPSHSHGLKPLPIQLKCWVVFVENNQKLYEIIFNSDAQLFDKYSPDFAHLLKTFRFE